MIIELTYLDGDVSKAYERGHVHIEDIINHIHLFQNTYIVFFHLSKKYWTHSKVINILADKLPPYFHNKCAISLKGFGSHEELTFLHHHKRKLQHNNSKESSSSSLGWGWARTRGKFREVTLEYNDDLEQEQG